MSDGTCDHCGIDLHLTASEVDATVLDALRAMAAQNPDVALADALALVDRLQEAGRQMGGSVGGRAAGRANT